jgi:glycolate oxidase iron-sulfur subunit
MKGATEGRIQLSPTVVGHFDACLGCMACVTACPSGVQYGPLIEATRAQIETHHRRPLTDRLFRAALFRTLPYPAIMRLVLVPLAAAGSLMGSLKRSAVTRKLPRILAAPVALAPRVSWSSLTARTPEVTAAAGRRRLRVGLLTGCIQRLVFPQVNAATIRVFAAEGCEVVAPPAQGCCGALSRHAGRLEEAREFARRTITAFESAGVECVVVNAAGCGSSMKEYGELLAHDPAWADRAHAFSRQVRDASELVAELGPRVPRHPIKSRVAYHDACHLSQAQGIRTQPRDVLESIPELELLEMPEPEICCGSAGIYNLVQPEAAEALGQRKARQVESLKPDAVATANPGCTLQIGAACERLGFRPRILHPLELLDASIRGAGLPDA